MTRSSRELRRGSGSERECGGLFFDSEPKAGPQGRSRRQALPAVRISTATQKQPPAPPAKNFSSGGAAAAGGQFAGGAIHTRLVPPDQRPCIAQAYWNSASPKTRRFLLWDIARDSRHELFVNIARDCPLFAGYLNDQLAGLVWFMPVSPLARCAVPHFSINIHDPSLALALGRPIIRQAASFFDSLLALVPKPLTGARKLARALGFAPKTLLPGACNLNGKIVAGELLALKFKGNAGALFVASRRPARRAVAVGRLACRTDIDSNAKSFPLRPPSKNFSSGSAAAAGQKGPEMDGGRTA